MYYKIEKHLLLLLGKKAIRLIPEYISYQEAVLLLLPPQNSSHVLTYLLPIIYCWSCLRGLRTSYSSKMSRFCTPVQILFLSYAKEIPMCHCHLNQGRGGRKLHSYNSLFGKGIIKRETIVSGIG